MKTKKKRLFILLTLFLTLILIFAATEILLRSTGHEPWTYYEVDLNEPVLYEPDPVLGWVHKAGRYTIPAYDESSDDITMTLLADGSRATGGSFDPEKRDLVILGGSFTQGWAISDWETFSWKLQRKFPEVNVFNFGTGGYGTYQSLLRLERLLDGGRIPALVVYGLVDIHEMRNVAPAGWLEMLSKYSQRGHVDVPYCTVDDTGALIRHTPEGYPSWPLRERLAAVAFLEKVYAGLTSEARLSQREKVTRKILLEMRDRCREKGCRFVVALLCAGNDTVSQYVHFLGANRIHVVPCVFPVTEEMKVPGEGHPSGRMNTLWADRIAEAIEDLLN